MTDSTINNLRDSIQLLKLTVNSINPASNSSNYFNYFAGIAGIIGTLIAIFTLYQYFRSKKLQDFLYKQAQIALEKESTQEELHKTKQELTGVETRLVSLQKQIQKDLPIEARKAVLRDRLEESFENLKKYYDDVIITKSKLSELGAASQISDELLKSIQEEIEPRYLLKEKISIYQTFLTIVTTLSGIAFGIIPYPFGNYIGGALLFIGLPLVIQVIRLSVVKNSKDKQKTNSAIKLGVSLFGTVLTVIPAFFFWAIILTSHKRDTDLLIFAMGLTLISLIIFVVNWRLFIQYRRVSKGS